MRKTPTLRAIATRAGVAVSTVSCALRHQAGVSKAEAERIREVAIEMGWRPNPLVSAWLSHVRNGQELQRHLTIGYLISDPTSLTQYFSSPIYRAYFEGAKSRAGELGFNLTPYHYEAYRPARLETLLRTQAIPGLVIAPLGNDRQQITLDWEGFAFSTIAYSLSAPAIHRAAAHHFHGTQVAVEALAALGYRRIGLAMPAHLDRRSGGMFLGGYLRAMLEVANSEPKLFLTPRRQFHLQGFNAWLDAESLDAVIGLKPVDSWIERWSQQRGRALAFANLDRSPDDVDHAGVDQQATRIGSAAVDVLTAQINRNERGPPAHPKLTLIESHWVPGPSAPHRTNTPG